MSIVKRISLPLFFSFLFINATAQHSLPDTIQAVVITEKINFDGKLTEPIWTNTLQNFFKGILIMIQRTILKLALVLSMTSATVIYSSSILTEQEQIYWCQGKRVLI